MYIYIYICKYVSINQLISKLNLDIFTEFPCVLALSIKTSPELQLKPTRIDKSHTYENRRERERETLERERDVDEKVSVV